MAGKASKKATKRATGVLFYVDGAGKHRWQVVARNGRIVADSGEGYSSAAKARQGARAAKVELQNWVIFGKAM